jgi:hypothetical protein
MTHTNAAKAMKQQLPSKMMKDLVTESIDAYNVKVKKNKSFQVNTEMRRMIHNLVKCPTECIDMLKLHYLAYKHTEAGVPCLLG